MKIDCVRVGSLEENCYIISKDGKCLVVDPGDEFDKIVNLIGNLDVLAILITHYHFDHVGALEKMISKYNAIVYDFNNTEEKKYSVGPFEFEVIRNPGHTNDSISFYFKENNFMMVGDFVFKESIGRCDLGGNEKDMKESISKLKEFVKKIDLYPGHGNPTNLEYEKMYNPFF